MKKLIFLLIVIAVIGVASFLIVNRKTQVTENKIQVQTEKPINNQKTNMTITSSAFSNKSRIPSKYTCDGENINPPLNFSDVSKDAKSLVLIVDDPDAPAKTWVHWVVYNIDPKTTQVLENSVPKDGVLGTTDFGKPGYGGPCPPSGTHRYFFKLYSLGTVLEVPGGLSKQQILEKITDRVIEEAELVGLYSGQ